MELAELIVFLALCYAVYKAFSPLQRYLERTLVRWFRRGSKNSPKPVIDITDYSKNSKNKEGS